MRSPTGPAGSQVLVIDDDSSYAGLMLEWLTESGHRVEAASTPEAGLHRLRENAFDVVLLDLAMPGMDGLSVLRRLNEQDRPEIIILSGGITVPEAVEAMKLGAFHCMPKTESMQSIEALVRRAAEVRWRERRSCLVSRKSDRRPQGPELVTASTRMREILRVLEDVAASQVSVLITGESGTGKDLLARLVHALSPRAAGPFVDLNCAALSPTLLEAEIFGHEKGAFTDASTARPGMAEMAHGGTLFLDEVVEMPPALQAKLLRMCENRTIYRVGGRQRIHVDIRIVAATNRDVTREIAEGRLREDLYYRLAGAHIEVPPLRERPEDIEPLLGHYLGGATRCAGRGPGSVAPEALELLRRYAWPGNVRELRNLVERSAWTVHGPVIERQHLPPEILKGVPRSAPAANDEPTLRDIERLQILKVLEEERWHHRRASERLGMPLRTLYRKVKAFDLKRPGAPSGGERRD